MFPIPETRAWSSRARLIPSSGSGGAGRRLKGKIGVQRVAAQCAPPPAGSAADRRWPEHPPGSAVRVWARARRQRGRRRSAGPRTAAPSAAWVVAGKSVSRTLRCFSSGLFGAVLTSSCPLMPQWAIRATLVASPSDPNSDGGSVPGASRGTCRAAPTSASRWRPPGCRGSPRCRAGGGGWSVGSRHGNAGDGASGDPPFQAPPDHLNFGKFRHLSRHAAPRRPAHRRQPRRLRGRRRRSRPLTAAELKGPLGGVLFPPARSRPAAAAERSASFLDGPAPCSGGRRSAGGPHRNGRGPDRCR